MQSDGTGSLFTQWIAVPLQRLINYASVLIIILL
jgi:hypothetical protein